MKDHCKISFDGTCIYLNNSVQTPLTGKIILFIINLFTWPLFVYAITFIPKNEVNNFILPLILVFLFLVYFLGRFSAWNFWGQEFVRINLKSISYSRSYGFVITKEKVIKISKLGFAYEYQRHVKNVEHGNLLFYNYDELDNPILVFETTVLISKENTHKIENYIQELFEQDFYIRNEVVPYTLN